MKHIKKLSLDRVAKCLKAMKALERRLKKHPDVIGIGVGFRERKGQIVQSCCIRVHVRRKFHRDAIAKRLLLPKMFKGFPVDVIQSAYRSHAGGDPSGRFDPLVGGIVVANARRFNEDGSIGTAGCVVQGASGETLLLSNWHVLYGTGGVDGERVVQPRPTGTLNDIGETFKGILNQKVDCAVARLSANRQHSRRLLGVPQPLGFSANAIPGMLVRKSGANGAGRGIVVGVHVSIKVDIEGTSHSFVDQIEIRPRPGEGPSDLNTDAGDSGALWITEPGADIVGLHVGGDTQRVVANRIDAVLTAFSASGIDLGI